jgi:hypothetical protein
MPYQTLAISQEGAAMFVDIAAPPMNLLGRNWSAIWSLSFSRLKPTNPSGCSSSKRRPCLFHFPRRHDTDQRDPGRDGEVLRRNVTRPSVSQSSGDPRRGRGPTPRTPYGPGQGSRSNAERGGSGSMQSTSRQQRTSLVIPIFSVRACAIRISKAGSRAP